ncbi:MAG TPA: Rieske 2Fe-2S domain-containing protein [Candidatus Binatia bacterium]|jgi:ferredoxin-nitrite reductase
MNKIEEYKKEKDGLDVLADVPRYAAEGWEAITDGDRERLKWTGVFFRKQTPGRFMMRIRIPNGISNAAQIRTIAEISEEFGKGFADITTRQQMQLRWFSIGDVPEIWRRLERVGLVSLQTGMDNIRNVVGCPAAGLTPNELFDASPVAREFTQMFVGNKAYTNLPRKFNVTITGCKENCAHAESQDIALTPASKIIDGAEVKGFNVAVGGKMASGGYRIASPLDLFVRPAEAAAICSLIVFIFRDHGLRESRSKARLAFLIEDWGVRKFRRELERRADRPLLPAGKDERLKQRTDHVGIFRQKQKGLNYAGLAVPVGRITTGQMAEVARVAEVYGSGEIRLTIGQNIIIPNVPDGKIGALTEEPLLKQLRYDPSEIMRGLVSCTGIDYCHFALIETKELALKTARTLEQELGKTKPVAIHWSGCPAGCGNHAVADIGLMGKNIKLNGEVVEAVDVFAAGAAGPAANPPIKIMEDVPCSDLPAVLKGLVRHGAFNTMRQQLWKMSQPSGEIAPPEIKEPPPAVIRADEIPDNAAKMVRMKGNEMAVFKRDGQVYAIQNICPHEGGQLSKGRLEGDEVVCPLHGYKFDLKTGRCSTDPALKAKVFKLVAHGGGFVVEEE